MDYSRRLGNDESEARSLQMVLRMLDRVDALAPALTAGQGPRIEPGSGLVGDDRRSRPFQVSHTVWSLISVSFDHLRALRALLVEAQVMNPHAPFTLIRGASESIATATWVIGGKSRGDRVARALRLANQNSEDGRRAAVSTGNPGGDIDEAWAERERFIDNLRKAEGLESLPQVKSTAVVQAAARLAPVTGNFEWAWRTASGFAHGRPWTTELLNRTQIAESGDTLSMRVESSAGHVLTLLGPVVEVFTWCLRTYTERAQCVLPGIPAVEPVTYGR